ncbi:MAG TPA: terminase [Myxococcales bacterium]|nr:terminase [Myxococcales bacterium]
MIEAKANDDRPGGLLAWQWSLYRDGHRDRRNLALHALTVPLFLAGTILLIFSLFAGAGLAIAGAASMLVALVAQGRGHAVEATRPVPFRGAGDFLARFFVEQWVTFPRFVLSGGFARAWRR